MQTKKESHKYYWGFHIESEFLLPKTHCALWEENRELTNYSRAKICISVHRNYESFFGQLNFHSWLWTADF